MGLWGKKSGTLGWDIRGFWNVFLVLNLLMMTKIMYHCQQRELYSIAELGWKLCLKYEVRFAGFKGKYTSAFISNQIVAVKAARELPDVQARGEVSETLHGKLFKKNVEVLQLWQALKRYISDAYAPALHKIYFESAGIKYYKKAKKDDWDNTEGLISSAVNFITNNQAVLEQDDNMPITFAPLFYAAQVDFLNLHTDFLRSRQGAVVETEHKIISNNLVHNNLISMLLDAQQVFRHNPVLKKQFTFSDLLYKTSGKGFAGIKGFVKDGVTKLPIEKATVVISYKNKSTRSDGAGRYRISKLRAGVYRFEVSAEGYVPFVVKEHRVKVGVVGIRNVGLVRDKE